VGNRLDGSSDLIIDRLNYSSGDVINRSLLCEDV